jgi:hypothetical protein
MAPQHGRTLLTAGNFPRPWISWNRFEFVSFSDRMLIADLKITYLKLRGCPF